MFEEEQYLSVFSDQTKNKTFLYSIKDGVDMQKYQTAVDKIKNSLIFENAPSELSSSDEDTNHKKPVYPKKSNKNSAKVDLSQIFICEFLLIFINSKYRAQLRKRQIKKNIKNHLN